MRTIILGGFLGSGKTTFLLKLITHAIDTPDERPPFAILENEIGSTGIDDQLISENGFAVKTMLAGCACCTLAGELPYAVMGIERDIDPQTLIIEATGIAIPSDMEENLRRALGIDALVCTLVDASRWRRIQNALSALIEPQLQGADIIIITKSDLVDEEELDYVRTNIMEHDTSAKIFTVSANDDIPTELMNSLLA